MCMKKLITVITATYNADKDLQACIDSIANQSFQDFEHVIIDGKSTDNTLDILKSNSDKIAYWVSEPDTGVYNAWNKIIPHINGKWILFLGADDILHSSNVFENISQQLINSESLHTIVYGICNRVNQNGTVIESQGEPWNLLKKKYRLGRILTPHHNATFHHYSLFNDSPYYDESLKISADLDLVIREISKTTPLFINEIITDFSMDGITGQSNISLASWKESRIIAKRYGLKIPLYHIIPEYLKTISKYIVWKYFPTQVARAYNDIGRILLGKKPHWISKKNS